MLRLAGRPRSTKLRGSRCHCLAAEAVETWGGAYRCWLLLIFIEGEAMDEVSEAECLICRGGARADRTEQRLRHFTKGGVLLIPRHDICPACEAVFFEKITATKHCWETQCAE